jgi:hypothetical protein
MKCQSSPADLNTEQCSQHNEAYRLDVIDSDFCPEDGGSTSLKHLYTCTELHDVLSQNQVIYIVTYRPIKAFCVWLYMAVYIGTVSCTQSSYIYSKMAVPGHMCVCVCVCVCVSLVLTRFHVNTWDVACTHLHAFEIGCVMN